MSIESFNGETFVAFLDVCGLKDMMNIRGKAEGLNRFFQDTYEEVERSRERSQVIDCIAVSDCAVAFARTSSSAPEAVEMLERPLISAQRLESMLIFVKSVARKMIRNGIAIKGSIAYGSLRYERRFEAHGIVKAMFLGDAYLNAYMDVEKGRPKLKLGQVKIRPKKKVKEILDQESISANEFALIALRKGNYYFYWMLDSIEEKDEFEREFKYNYQRLFDGVISVIRSYASPERYRV